MATHTQKSKSLLWSVSAVALALIVYSLAAPPQKQAEAPSSGGEPVREQEGGTIQTAAADTLKTDFGSIIYGADDRAINLVLDLDRLQYDQVGITFLGADDKGVMFGDMISSVKVGHVDDETTFVPVNHKLVLWTQLPIRFLGETREGWLEMTDKESGKSLFKEKLSFR
ncbi:hypothetical protein RJP21_17100 [Paenibacillus sp. VCA1]|uniref:hypothetical protein n=1 Tax=Paenibacillus sp. VCA1 TaxID=3039148 RepID=UPI0028710172|nr:hypothetical protein [Paenibacillus sp. VCA1]MDR9855337.1 hypothetical protein [Paenibacillus sp. VCA1]